MHPQAKTTSPAPFITPLIDLAAQRRRLGDKVDSAIQNVLAHGKYILGPEVQQLETALTHWSGRRHAVGVSSGTDALAILLMAWGLRPGDAVLVPDFTFAATAEVVAWLGATPVFCDVREDTFNLDPDSLRRGIDTARAADLQPRAVIAVDLFGQPADYDAITMIARKHGLHLLVDAAQSFGADFKGRPCTAFGDAAATSFFPAKPLGGYGDGGAVFLDDDELAATVRSLRVHGQGENKYDTVAIGMNGRLDTMQAAVLLEKLEIFEDELQSRQQVAARYAKGLSDVVLTPRLRRDVTSTWAQYTIRVANRDALAQALVEHGVANAIYYPKPLSDQLAYQRYPKSDGGTPTAARLSKEVISLPMHPYLDATTQEQVIIAVRQAAAEVKATHPDLT